MAPRSKPYSLVGEPNAETIARIDEMFDTLFDDLERVSEGSHPLLSGAHTDTTADDVEVLRLDPAHVRPSLLRSASRKYGAPTTAVNEPRGRS